MANEFQKQYEHLLKIPHTWKTDGAKWSKTPFSPFNTDDITAAVKLAGEYLEHSPHHIIGRAQDHITNETHDPELVRYALLLYGVHHPEARKISSFPRLIQRNPRLALPSPNNPDPISWFSEDPNLNEHHEHWHLVYPGRDLGPPKDRHGEIFLSMHRQMLARYDAERFCSGQSPVTALDIGQPLHSQYTPSNHLKSRGPVGPFAARPDGLQVQDTSPVKDPEQRIKQAIQDGNFTTPGGGKVPITADNLGRSIEAYNTPNDFYGNMHNSGHGLIASLNHVVQSGVQLVGVMNDPRTACRDPIFWQWHRFIDSFYSLWQDTQPVKDWNQDPPPSVKVLKIALAFNDVIGKNDPSKYDINDKNKVTTELQTTFLTRTFTWVEDDKRSEKIRYLFPREFTYFFQVQNTSNQPISTTFRVFFVPDSLIDSRANWIELDKFRQDIPASATTLVSRNCDLSSVIRKPAQKLYSELDKTAVLTRRDADPQNWCDCGWPFHLLLPKGNDTGAKFKLFVFISDWTKDEVKVINDCGSLSFCGTFNKYPDRRPLGYPFDSPFKNGKFSDTFQGLPNCGELDITIKSTPDGAPWAKPYAEP